MKSLLQPFIHVENWSPDLNPCFLSITHRHDNHWYLIYFAGWKFWWLPENPLPIVVWMWGLQMLAILKGTSSNSYSLLQWCPTPQGRGDLLADRYIDVAMLSTSSHWLDPIDQKRILRPRMEYRCDRLQNVDWVDWLVLPAQASLDSTCHARNQPSWNVPL